MDQTLYILMVNHKPIDVTTVLKEAVDNAKSFNNIFKLGLTIPRYNTISQSILRNKKWVVTEGAQRLSIYTITKSIV